MRVHIDGPLIVNTFEVIFCIPIPLPPLLHASQNYTMNLLTHGPALGSQDTRNSLGLLTASHAGLAGEFWFL